MKRSVIVFAVGAVLALMIAAAATAQKAAGPGTVPDVVGTPYELNTGLQSRTISFENPTGERGGAGKTSSNLGVGRKGSPMRVLKPGETAQMCDIAGPGTIRHIWVTISGTPENLRGCVIRGYWEGQTHPGIECPIGDFMGMAHGKVMPYQSAVHSVGPSAGMNMWLPMPFAKRAKFTFTNETGKDVTFFYYIDLTLGDRHPSDVGRFHALFRRENPTTMKRDFEILPKRTGKGRFVGAVIGIRALTENWWGEGEVKVYMDGDTEFPTICGTGSEDYVGLSWGIQQVAYQYNGCSLNQNNFISMYRWHLPDPVYWKKDCRITIQQIGWKDGLYERSDDWCCAAFWYEPTPDAPLPAMPDFVARTSNLWVEEKK